MGATLTCGVLLQPILAHAEAWEHLCHMVVTVQGPPVTVPVLDGVREQTPARVIGAR